MAKGMLGSAMLSGFGQGLTTVSNSLGQAAQLYGASWLQRERQDMENKRLALIEQYAAAREQRGYDFQHGIQQEKIGADILARSQDRQERADERAKDREFQAGQQQERIGADIVGRSQERDFRSGENALDRSAHKEERAETIGFQREKLRSDEQQHRETMQAQKSHWDAIEKQFAQKHGDLSEKDKEFVRVAKERGAALYKMSEGDGLSEKERTAYRELGDQEFQRAYTRLGYVPEAPRGNNQIKDRFGLSPNKVGKPAPPPMLSTPSKVTEEYRAAKQAEADQRREETKRGAMEAMGYESGTGMAVKAPPPPTTPAPKAAPRMEHQRPTGMQQPGEALPPPPLTPPAAPPQSPVVANVPRELPRATPSTTEAFLADKRAEAAQREQAVLRPKAQGNPLIGDADASPHSTPQKLGRLGTEITGETAEARPTAKAPDDTVQRASSFKEIIDSLQLPADQHNEVKAKISRAMHEFGTGKTSELEFRTDILEALVGLPGSITDYLQKSNAVADSVIRELRGVNRDGSTPAGERMSYYQPSGMLRAAQVMA